MEGMGVGGARGQETKSEASSERLKGKQKCGQSHGTGETKTGVGPAREVRPLRMSWNLPETQLPKELLPRGKGKQKMHVPHKA